MKKIIMFLLVAALLVPGVTFAETGGNALFPDVMQGTAANEAAMLLSALGIMEGFPDGTFRPDDNITRAEFAAIIIRAQGHSGLVPQTETRFTDVPYFHWASGYVRMAANQGVVRGTGDDIFAPEDYVTYEQAVAMIMRMLGYGPMAQNRGGFPTGYLIAAATAGVTDRIGVVEQTELASRGLVARLMNNAMVADMMVNTWGFGTIVVERQNLLFEAFRVTRLRAQITANQYTSLEAPFDSTEEWNIVATILDDYRTFNPNYSFGLNNVTVMRNVPFRRGNTNAADFLGRQVILFVQEEAGFDEDVIIVIVDVPGRNAETSFDIADFYSFDAINGRLIYIRDGARIVASHAFSNNFSVIYNGRAMSVDDVFTAGTNYIMGEEAVSGTLTALDSAGVGFYDVIFIDTYPLDAE